MTYTCTVLYFKLKLKRVNVFVVISEIHKQYLYFKYILKKKSICIV